MTQNNQNNAATLPAGFLAKMERLLGAEYEQFLHSYANEPRGGLRVNTLKISVPDFIRKSPFTLSPLGNFEAAAFLVGGDERPGSHPYHAAGLYYLQEPSAMVVASLVRPRPGEVVLDLAAAPGGKATHLATLMADTGLLVANDVSASRAQLLAQNLERWGVRNTLITSVAPERLATTFGPIFDRVLVDAPCSGEGMFRRQGSFEWSQAIVQACARRQTGILDTAAELVRPGGLLVYATCTFAPEENEAAIARFLARHAGYELEEPPRLPGFAPGRPDWVADESLADETRQQLGRAVRLWPHRFPGEGHFIALLRRHEAEEPAGSRQPARYPSPRHAELMVWRQFADEHLHVDFPEERMTLVNNRLYLLPARALDAGGLKIIRYGLLLGEMRRGYFRPSHTLAMSLAPAEVRLSLSWAAGAPEVQAYLAGHDAEASGPEGWVLVAVDGHPLGWAKRVAGRLKNHYPRGLRYRM